MGEFVKKHSSVGAVQVQVEDAEAITVVRSGHGESPYLITYNNAFGDVYADLFSESDLRRDFEIDETCMAFINQELGL